MTSLLDNSRVFNNCHPNFDSAFALLPRVLGSHSNAPMNSLKRIWEALFPDDMQGKTHQSIL